MTSPVTVLAIHNAISAVAPINGVNVGPGDMSTWQIHFAPEATAEQRAAALALLASLDPLLIAAKLTKREKIAAVFEAKIADGVAHRGKIIQVDDTSRSNIISMALTAKLVIDGTPGVTWPAEMANVGWRTKDNSYLPMTAPQMVTMALTCMQRFMAMRYRYGALKDAVAAARTVAEVEAIDASSGWE